MKELILLGGGESRKECPYNTEVWAASSVLSLPETRLEGISKAFAFDLYPLVKPYLKIAKEHNIPVVSTRSYADEQYPWKEITEEFQTKYFRNSISYMIAMAVYKGYEKLRIYGVDQGPDYEYLAAKPYVMFWLGVAIGRGIEWEVAGSGLLFYPLISSIKKQLEADMERAAQWLPRNKARLAEIGELVNK